MTVQLCATAFGSALAGLVVNLAGGCCIGHHGSGEYDRRLFITVAMAPAIYLVVMGSRSFQALAAEQGRTDLYPAQAQTPSFDVGDVRNICRW